MSSAKPSGLLYIANCTPMRQLVMYKLMHDAKGIYQPSLASRSPFQEVIEPGRQVALAGKLHMEQMNEIIDQLSAFGMIAASDVPNNLYDVAPLVFSIDAPVPRHVFEDVVAHNKGIKLESGAKRREQAAIAANQALVNNTGEESPVFEVAYEQETLSDLDESRIEEGFKVVNEKKGPPPPSRPRRVA